MSTQKEMQKQMNVIVSGSVTKEGKRLEGSLGRSMEKVVKANTEALWARFQEENAKQEKLEQDRMQQITNLITNYMNKDLPTMLEKTLKKEIALVGPAVARAITPVVDKTMSSAIMESLQVLIFTFVKIWMSYRHFECSCFMFLLFLLEESAFMNGTIT